MSFCPKCNVHHDPSMPCFNRTEEILRDIGIQRKRMSQKEFKTTVQKTNRGLIVVMLIFIGGIPLGILVGAIMERIKQMMH